MCCHSETWMQHCRHHAFFCTRMNLVSHCQASCFKFVLLVTQMRDGCRLLAFPCSRDLLAYLTIALLTSDGAV